MKTQIKEASSLRYFSAARFHNYIILRIHEAENQIFYLFNAFNECLIVVVNVCMQDTFVRATHSA